ncbi:stearoyl-CoA desaturase 5-like protein, partial [Leptotrombidium deliense]
MLCFILPTAIPYYYWNETVWNAFFVCALFRLCFSLNVAFCVNSVTHIWGNKPYDQNILSTENVGVSFLAVGEGYHNYHHTFPWDYSTSEFGWKVNPTTLFIDTCAWLGLVYDRKSAS